MKKFKLIKKWYTGTHFGKFQRTEAVWSLPTPPVITKEVRANIPTGFIEQKHVCKAWDADRDYAVWTVGISRDYLQGDRREVWVITDYLTGEVKETHVGTTEILPFKITRWLPPNSR